MRKGKPAATELLRLIRQKRDQATAKRSATNPKAAGFYERSLATAQRRALPPPALQGEDHGN